MKVSELRKLVNELPKNMTQEQFDNLTVLFSGGDAFHTASVEESGVTTFCDPCDENGNPVEETFTEEELTFFCLISTCLADELNEE